MTSNVNGRKKPKLDPSRIAFIKRASFESFPLTGEETEKRAWGGCVEAIDEANRRLNRPKK